MYLVVVGGLVDTILPIGPKVYGFGPGRGLWVLRTIKIRSTPSFEGEINSSTHVVRFYCMLMIASKHCSQWAGICRYTIPEILCS
jgi:hypothetical protein